MTEHNDRDEFDDEHEVTLAPGYILTAETDGDTVHLYITLADDPSRGAFLVTFDSYEQYHKYLRPVE